VKPTYDIGIGRCSEADGETVYVRLDALIAKRLAPESAWNRSGTSVLRFPRAYCSELRPPKAGEECYLDAAALSRAAPAELDLFGNERFTNVDLRVILTSMAPIGAAPTPATKLSFPRRSK